LFVQVSNSILNFSFPLSPRSISSNSSVASLSNKRKYGNSLDPNFNHKPSFDYINYARSPSTGVLSCIYCTKSDFASIDQLHVHVQAMHGGLLRGEGLADARYSPNVPITCEFCTMKCPSLQILFHHLKATHMDRIGSPNSYLEQFSRHLRTTSETKSPLAGEVVKTEARGETPKQNGKNSMSPAGVENIKLEKSDSEEQTTPTDLSQPKEKRMKVEAVGEDPKSGPAEPSKPPAQPDQFLCNQCNAALPDFESFRNHLRSHLDQPSTSFLCQHCAVSFTDPVEYERHVITHFLVTSSEFACTNTCNKAFGKPDDLQKHLFELHSVSLYKCNICAEVFDTKVAIKVHFAVAHSNEVKLFRCSACSDTFRSERDFR
jgi:zinc finger protein 423